MINYLNEKCITKPFIWKTHDGRKLTVQKMETPHLFNIVKMVWNHSCPEELKFKPYREWNLNLDVEYLKEVVKRILVELSTREDLTQEMIDIIKQMKLKQSLLQNHLRGLINAK